jgi:hypothetical protein
VPEAARMRLISAREGCWGKTTRSKSFLDPATDPGADKRGLLGPARSSSFERTPEEPAPCPPPGMTPEKALA